MSFDTLDKEIHDLEERIARDRAEFMSALTACGDSVRESVSSPKSLLAVAGIGFVAGKLLFRSGGKAQKAAAAPPARTGALGLLAAGLSLMQPGFGAGGIVRWAAKQMWDRRKANQQNAARRPSTTTTVDVVTPVVRTAPRRPTAVQTSTAAGR